MTSQLKTAFFLTFIAFWGYSCTEAPPPPPVIDQKYDLLGDSIRRQWAPDQRVDRFKPVFSLGEGEDCPVINGRTTRPSAAAALRAALAKSSLCFQDSLVVLPLPTLGADTFGLVNVSVANLRTHPKHSAELTTQSLLGTPLRVYDEQNGWYLVRTPDRYLAWLEAGAFVRGPRSLVSQYFQGSPVVVTSPSVRLTDRPAGGKVIRELSTGNLLQSEGRQGPHEAVRLPDGSRGYLPANALNELRQFATRAQSLELPLLARQFYGLPYLWGGTSAKGLDCSGFTKMTYYLNGYVIPRDASQQVLAGTEVPLDDRLTNCRPGDLLFFGNLRDDGSQRISHVGIYLGNGRFVHSGADNGFIREQSLFPEADDYTEKRKSSLLRAKRLSIGSEGVVPLLDVLAAG